MLPGRGDRAQGDPAAPTLCCGCWLMGAVPFAGGGELYTWGWGKCNLPLASVLFSLLGAPVPCVVSYFMAVVTAGAVGTRVLPPSLPRTWEAVAW